MHIVLYTDEDFKRHNAAHAVVMINRYLGTCGMVAFSFALAPVFFRQESSASIGHFEIKPQSSSMSYPALPTDAAKDLAATAAETLAKDPDVVRAASHQNFGLNSKDTFFDLFFALQNRDLF